MPEKLELTVGDLLPFFDKHELLLIADQNGVELFSNDAGSFRAEYILQEDICLTKELRKLKVKQISCTDDGDVYLLVNNQ